MNYIIHDILFMDEVIASVLAIYEYHSSDANSIIQNIIRNIRPLKVDHNNLYIDFLILDHSKMQKLDFLDNQY